MLLTLPPLINSSYLTYSAIHCQIIITGGDNQVDLTDFTTGIYPIAMVIYIKPVII